MDRTASGWSVSITPIPSAERRVRQGGVLHSMITGIDTGRLGRIGTRMQQHCWQTSGERLRLCSKYEV
jgi:hypothetical protein